MKRNVFFGMLFSAALAVGVTAQGTGTATGSQADQKYQSQKNQQVTVTGCLKEADVAGGTAGTSGTGTAGTQASGSARSGAQFVLTNAKVTSRGSGDTTSGTSGTGAAAGAAGTVDSNRFLLTGGNQQDLKKNLNSEVEIRGTLQAPGSVNKPDTGTGAATSSSRSQSDQNLQTLRVSSVKQTSPTCTSGN